MRHQATLFEQVVEIFPWQRFDHYVRRPNADARQGGFSDQHATTQRAQLERPWMPHRPSFSVTI